MANNVEGKYRVTATIKADTIDELEAIEAELTRVGATFLHIDPSRSSRMSVQTHQSMRLDQKGRAPLQ
jgi:hypothetical protein